MRYSLIGLPPRRGGWLARWGLALGLLALSTARPGLAQTVSQAEYFLDTPPAYGSGTAIALTPAADISGLSFSVPLGSVSAGFHLLGLRSKDGNGNWSLTTTRSFYYDPSVVAATGNITRAEYFLDTPPAFGAGVNVPLTAAQDISGLAFAVSLSSVSAGFHQIGVRSQDASGKWSLTSTRTFYYDPSVVAAVPNVMAAEYFLDTPPAYGSGTNIPLTAATDVSGMAFTVNLGSVSAGFHQIGVRSKDGNGNWSLTSTRAFYYDPNPVAGILNVTKAEYFIDTPPVYGSGVNVPLTAAPDISGLALSIDVSALSKGFHQLGIRSRDGNGNWSLTTTRAFYLDNVVLAAGNVNKVEYYFDTDPGFGSGVAVPVTAAPDLNSFNFVADASALASGPHKLFVRSRDVGGSWSLTAVSSFTRPAVAGPTISSFAPAVGTGGTLVTLTGSNFTGATSATFNGVAGTSFTVVSSTQITVLAPAGASTGVVCVVGTAGTGCSAAGTVFTYAPVVTGISPTTLCAGNAVSISFTATGYAAGNTFTAQLSNSSGAFSTGVLSLGTLSGATGGTITGTVPTTTSSPSYRIRIVANNPAVIGADNGTNLSLDNNLSATASSNSPVSSGGTISLSVSAYVGGSTFAWTGPGTLINPTSAGPTVANATTANSGTYQVVITGFGGCQVTRTVNVTVNPPLVIITGAVSAASYCAGDNINVPYTVSGGPALAGNTFTAQLSNASGSFTTPVTIGSVSSTTSGSIAAVLPTGTPTGSGYRVRVVATNPATTGANNGTDLSVINLGTSTASSNSNGAGGAPFLVAGSTLQFTTTGSGIPAGTTYAWTGPGGFTSAQQNPTIANAQTTATGQYQVVISSGGCSRTLTNVYAQIDPALTGLFGNTVTMNGSTDYIECGNDPALNPGTGDFTLEAWAKTNSFGAAGSGLIIVQKGLSITGSPSNAGYGLQLKTPDKVQFTVSDGSIQTVSYAGLTTGTWYHIVGVRQGNTLTLYLNGTAVASTVSASTANANTNLQLAIGTLRYPSPGAYYSFNGSLDEVRLWNTARTTAQIQANLNHELTGTEAGLVAYYDMNRTGAGAGLQVLNGASATGATTNGLTAGTSTTPIFTPANNPGTTPTNTLVTDAFTGSFCGGATLSVPFTASGFGVGNVYTAQLSDASGSFAAPTSIGTLTNNATSGSIAATLPAGTATGTAYRVRVVASAPAYVSTTDNGSNLTITTPPTATPGSNSPVASGGTIQLTAATVAGATYAWTGPSFSSTQQNPTIASATPANSGTYTLSVTVSGCQSPGATTAVTVNAAPSTTLTMPTFSNGFCAGNTYNIGYAVGGAGLSSGGTLTVQLSDGAGSFTTPTNLGSISFIGTGSGTIAALIPTSNAVGSLYRIRVVSTNPTLASNDNGTNLVVGNVANVVASSNSPVAAGATINLSSNGILAGATYGWTGPNGFSSGQLNPSIPNANAANAGNYQLSVSINGCSVVRTITVSISTGSLALTTGGVSGSYCPGATLSVPFTVTTGTPNAGNVFTVQLSDAGGTFTAPVNIGSLTSSGSTGTITAAIPLGTPAGSGYRVRVVTSTPAAVGSDNGTNLTVGALTYAWTGAVSTDWFNAANWSCGQVPNATSVVIIGNGASFYPVITGSTAALALNLTIQSGATFTNNGLFYLYGSVTVNGTVAASLTSGWYFAGTGNQFIYGANPLQVGNVYINSGSTLTMNNVLNVYASWYNYGTFVGGVGYNVYFNGAGGTQYIGGTSVSTFYNVYVNSGAVVNLGINTIFLNNFVVNGAFGAASYGVVFGGSTSQTIGGTGTSTYYNVTITNTVGLTLVSTITVLGDWLNNGLFFGGTYSVIFGGTTAQLIGGTQVTNFYNVTFQNLVSVTLTQNIYVLGGFVNTGVFYGYQVIGGVTNGYYVRFGGTVAQVINANATTYFYHFYVDNAAGVSLNTNIYIAGNYYLYAGSFAPGTFTVFFNGTGGLVQTVGGYIGLSFYGWNIVSGAYVRLIQDVTWLGGFVNNGAFYGYNLVGGVYTGYTGIFGGSGAQVLSGSGVSEFWHVTWNNLAGITLNQNISVWGNWLNNGGYVANGYLVSFIGNVAQLIGGSVNTTFYHITITNLVSVSLNQPIVVLGNWGGVGVFLGNGYLVYFNGTTAQTILTGLATRFFDIRFNNATSVTLLSPLYLAGNWTNDGGFLANGFGVYFAGLSGTQLIAGSVLTQFYHFTILTGAQVQLARVISVLGDWTNNGVFLHGNFTVTFAGSIAQLIGGSTSTIFYGLTFANTGTVTLAQNIRVRGGWLNNGVFAPGTFIVYFDGSIAQVIGGSAVSTFFGLNILNTVGVSLSGPIFIRGNLVNDGLFTCAGYLVTFNGTTLQSIGGLSTTIFGDITTNNAVGVALGQNIRVRGDFRNLALFAAGGYIVYFDGSLAQAIYSTGTLTFHDVVFANLAGITLQNNIFLTGNWTNNGGFLANGKLVTFSGSVLQLIGGSVATVFHHFTIALGATVQQNLGITLLGDWTNNGSFLANSLLTYFNGTVLQTIAGSALTTFYDVTFNNAVNVALGQNIDVLHNFVNQGGYCGCGFRTRFNGTVAQSITCTSGRTHFHDITFANAAGVTLLDGIYVSGQWVNNGGYLANNKTVIFDGTVLQTIAGSVLSAFYNVGITNAVNVQLLRDITVAGFWNNTGIFTGNGFGVTFNGLALQTITTTGALARTTFHHVTWANLVGCVLGGDVYVQGNWRCNGPFNPATFTTFFNGTVAQSCGGSSPVRFFGLNVSNPVGLTCSGPVYLLGNFVNTGLVNCGAFGWYCIGTTAQTIGGVSLTPTRFYDLFIQNGSGVTGTDNFFLTHVLTLTTGNLASNGHLTLTSNAGGTAMVVNPTGGGVVTGVSTMERFISGLSGAPGYRHYSSPMQLSAAGISTTVQEFADNLPVFELNPAYNTVGKSVTPFPTLFKYDETRLTAAKPTFDDGFMVPTATEDLQPLRGYTAQTLPTTTVDIRGLLQTGNVSYSLTRGSLANSGWHLLGNPYPAPMDWDVVRTTSGMLAGVADALYVFQPSGTYTGTYKAYVNGLGQNGGGKDLAAMQGFFVRATAPTAAVSLTNAVRATSYLSPVFERQTATTGTSTTRLVLRLLARNEANRTADETVIYFEPAAGLGFSARHDAYKVQLNGNGRPSLWSQAGTESFAINGLPDLTTAPVIPLGVRVSQDGAHRLVLTGLTNAPAGTQVWLEDRVLNRRQNLARDTAYAFTMLASYTGQRFYLNFTAGSPLAVTTGQLDARTALYPNPTTGTATLELTGLREQGAVAVDVVNVLGQVVRHLSSRPSQGMLRENLDLQDLPTGVYLVRVHAQEGLVIKRLVRE